LTVVGGAGLTVAVYSEGYTPSEQLAGKPHFASDLYSLGLVAIEEDELVQIEVTFEQRCSDGTAIYGRLEYTL